MAFPAHAGTHGPFESECEKALFAIREAMGDVPETEDFNQVRDSVESVSSVIVEKSIRGEHGGHRLILKRVGARWISNYRSVDFDPQGDPRWFIEVMGVDAAAFFGFKILDNEHVMVPDGHEFNGALEKIDQHLRAKQLDPILVRYYVVPNSENVKVEFYTKQFGEKLSLPMAPEGHHLIHDLSFHTGAIFISAKLMRLRAFTTRYKNGFIDFLNKKYAGQVDKVASVKYLAYLWRLNETFDIDESTGTINPGIIATLRNPGTENSLQMLMFPMISLSGGGYRPVEEFSRQILALDPKSRATFADSYGSAKVEKMERTLQHLSIETLLKDQREYHSTMSGDKDFKAFAGLSYPYDQDIYEGLCKEIGERRLLIRSIALELAGHRSP